MNFLAHAYLSFNEPDILVGNMISDFVKGKEQYLYAPSIQKGIRLHRMIDAFTDVHPVIQEAKKIFRPAYRLYSSPIIDILFDHFLATDENSFKEGDLHTFTMEVYHQLEQRTVHLPNRFLQVLTYMKAENWLLNYSEHYGMERSLRGLVRRASFVNDSATAYGLYHKHYEELRSHFNEFFPAVKSFAKDELDKLNS